jgi:thioredoxin reductase
VETRGVEAVVGEAPAVSGIRLHGGEVVPVDAIFTASRTRLASPIAGQLGCAIHDGPQGPVIRTDDTQATSVAGVYAAGDAARGWHTVSFAVAAGVAAGIAAHRSLALDASLPAHA